MEPMVDYDFYSRYWQINRLKNSCLSLINLSFFLYIHIYFLRFLFFYIVVLELA